MELIYPLIALAGIASHVFYFNRGEHHFNTVRYLQVAFFVLSGFAYLQSTRTTEPLGQVLKNLLAVSTAYLTGLYASLLTHRLFLSPLNKFPGPFVAKITSLWLTIHSTSFRGYKALYFAHEKYGEFVRVGSNSISITHPKAVNVIYGHGSKCTKSDWYDLTRPMVSMHTLRDRAEHDKRRRVWSAAFGDKALRGYEERIKKYQQQLVSQLRSLQGQEVNATKWFNAYSFDVMGDLAFGASFGMLKDSEPHWAIKLMHEGMKPMGVWIPMWLFRSILVIPKLLDDWFKFIDYCSQRVVERMNTHVEIPDIMSALLQPHKGRKPTEEEMLMLRGDSQLVVVAGSDTTSATLTYVFYELARHPEQITKLRSEISSLDSITGPSVQNLEHLNGVINEALRLHPVVPTAQQRLTPKEGITIGDTYVPGNTVVWCPQYAIHRNESVFPDANAFIPERWYTPGMVTERTAFFPFSTGNYNCIGRPLALMNIRTTIAKLLMDFDFEFAPGEIGQEVEDSPEHFTAAPGDMRLVFWDRKERNESEE